MTPPTPSPGTAAVCTNSLTQSLFAAIFAPRKLLAENYKWLRPHREVVWVILGHFRKAVFSCCCRCGHVGNALALSIVSTAMSAAPPARSQNDDRASCVEAAPGRMRDVAWLSATGWAAC